MRNMLFWAAMLAALPGQAATLRPSTSLSAPVVRLADLFDDAGAQAGTVLGPAPRPGERIVVEAAQLAAIARQFGVAWRPASAADRAVLDQPGRALPREAVAQAVQSALARAGADDGEADLSGFEPPLIPLLANPAVTVEQLDFDRASGRFVVALRAEGGGMPPLRFAAAGRLEPVADVVVPAHALAGGTLLRQGDVRLARVRLSALRGDAVRDVASAAGQMLRRPVPAGQPLQAADLTRPLLVAKGARVAMELRVPGLAITAQGVALQAGAAGEMVQVLNPVSHMVVEAEVTGPGRVVVAAGAAPVSAEAQVAAR